VNTFASVTNAFVRISIITFQDLSSNDCLLLRKYEIIQGIQIQCEFAFHADNFSKVFLPRSHHPNRINIQNPSIPDLHDSHRIILVFTLAKLGLHRRNARRAHTDDRALAVETEREVDVDNGAVNEDAAREVGVRKILMGRVFVACLAAEDKGPADEAGGAFVAGVAVGGVGAAGEAARDFEVRTTGGDVNYGLRQTVCQ